eukprot:INCI895.1.p1 GENE.INCI895.1~~INCI895.1.p1  ORF type:complete len:1011 (+),score=102.85 INCI895.1:361-3033(+)
MSDPFSDLVGDFQPEQPESGTSPDGELLHDPQSSDFELLARPFKPLSPFAPSPLRRPFVIARPSVQNNHLHAATAVGSNFAIARANVGPSSKRRAARLGSSRHVANPASAYHRWPARGPLPHRTGTDSASSSSLSSRHKEDLDLDGILTVRPALHHQRDGSLSSSQPTGSSSSLLPSAPAQPLLSQELLAAYPSLGNMYSSHHHLQPFDVADDRPERLGTAMTFDSRGSDSSQMSEQAMQRSRQEREMLEQQPLQRQRHADLPQPTSQQHQSHVQERAHPSLLGFRDNRGAQGHQYTNTPGTFQHDQHQFWSTQSPTIAPRVPLTFPVSSSREHASGREQPSGQLASGGHPEPQNCPRTPGAHPTPRQKGSSKTAGGPASGRGRQKKGAAAVKRRNSGGRGPRGTTMDQLGTMIPTFASSPEAAAMGATLRAELAAANAAITRKNGRPAPTPKERRLKHNATERYRTFLISEKVAELGQYLESTGRDFKAEKLHILVAAVDAMEELIEATSAPNTPRVAAEPHCAAMAGTFAERKSNGPLTLVKTESSLPSRKPDARDVGRPTPRSRRPSEEAATFDALTVFSHFPAPRIVFDDHGHVVAYNQEFAVRFGWPKDSNPSARHLHCPKSPSQSSKRKSQSCDGLHITDIYSAPSAIRVGQAASSGRCNHDAKLNLWDTVTQKVRALDSGQQLETARRETTAPQRHALPRFVVVKDVAQCPDALHCDSGRDGAGVLGRSADCPLVFEAWVSSVPNSSSSPEASLLQAVFVHCDLAAGPGREGEAIVLRPSSSQDCRGSTTPSKLNVGSGDATAVAPSLHCQTSLPNWARSSTPLPTVQAVARADKAAPSIDGGARKRSRRFEDLLVAESCASQETSDDAGAKTSSTVAGPHDS